MADRFSSKYSTPWVSQYVPLPLSEIQKGYEYQQKKYDEGMAAASDKPVVAPGRTTVKHAEELTNKVNADFDAKVAEAQKTGDYGQLKYWTKSYTDKLKASPIYQAIEEDRLIGNKLAESTLAEPGSENYIQGFHSGQDYIQQDSSKIPSLGFYKTLRPKSVTDDHQTDFYQHLKSNLKKVGAAGDVLVAKEAGYKPDGTPILRWFNQTTQQMEKGINESDVKTIADNWVKDSSHWKTKQSVMYSDALKRNLTQGQEGYTPEEYSNDLVKGFTGYNSETADVTTEKEVSTPKGTKSGDGSLTDFGIRNHVLHMQEDLDKSPDGTASVNNHVAGALLGGDYDKGSGLTTISVNSDEPTLLVVPKTISGAKNEKDNIDVSKAIPYKIELNNLKRVADNKLSEASSNGTGYTDPKNGNLYYKDANGSIHEQTSSGGKRLITLDQFVKTQNEGITLYDKANSQGVNLDDPKYSKALSSKKPEDLEFVNNFSIQTSNLNGQFEFLTDSNSKNVFTGDDGSPYVKGFVKMTEDEAKQQFGNTHWWGRYGFEKAEELGLIKKQSKLDKEGNVIYNIPMIRKSVGNLADASIKATMNQYGDKEKVEEISNAFAQQNLNYKQSRTDQSSIENNVKMQMSSKENADNYNIKLDKFIGSAFKDDAAKARAYTDWLDEINTSDESDIKKAQARHLLELKVRSEQGDEVATSQYNLLLNAVNPSETTAGKPQPGTRK